MKSVTLVALYSVLLFMLCLQSQAQSQNKLTKQEKKGGWTLLFDGHSTDQWRKYTGKDFPKNGWNVHDGMLTVLRGGQGGTIITKKKYGNFILTLDWKISKGGNSGVFYRALEQQKQAIYWSAPEMAVLDDANYSYASGKKLRQAGSLYALIAAKPANVRRHGQWNHIKIVANGPYIEHWQNGKKVVEYQLWTPRWYKMVRNSKFANHPAFGDMHSGYIGLQDEGYSVSFRNIKIKELK